MTPAPFHSEIARGPDGGFAVWGNASDGVRVRVGLWPAAKAQGTVLIYPGRTEYIEKYGHVAACLVAAGYNVASIDWRGQGLADRLVNDPYRGHVGHFDDYQKDVEVLRDAAREAGFVGPHFLLGHSMGGCIGLRSLLNGLDVKRTIFSAPMWGIKISPVMRRVAWTLSRLAAGIGAGMTLTPGTQPRSFILNDPFEDNTLTRDRDMWAHMGAQIRAVPGFELGGPSLDWLRLALNECAAAAREGTPDVPCLTFLGSNERIVDTAAIHDRMNAWPKGQLELVDHAEHEVLMDLPDTRDKILRQITSFLKQSD